MSLIISVIHTLFSLYSLAFVANAFLSMLAPTGVGPFYRVIVFLRRITEPVLAPIRRLIPPIQSGGVAWDLSPMVAIVLLLVVEQILTRLLLTLV